MKITLKKVLYCGFALLITLCFFLMLALPVTLKVGNASYSGSFLRLIGDNTSGIAQIIKQDALASAIKDGTTTALSKVNENAESLISIYQSVGIVGLIIVLVVFLIVTGVFFIPSMKIIRIITIPTFALAAIYFIVLISFGASLGVSTAEFMKPDLLPVKSTYGAPVLLGLVVVLFIAMLIVPGFIMEKVLFDKTKRSKKK